MATARQGGPRFRPAGSGPHESGLAPRRARYATPYKVLAGRVTWRAAAGARPTMRGHVFSRTCAARADLRLRPEPVLSRLHRRHRARAATRPAPVRRRLRPAVLLLLPRLRHCADSGGHRVRSPWGGPAYALAAGAGRRVGPRPRAGGGAGGGHARAGGAGTRLRPGGHGADALPGGAGSP